MSLKSGITRGLDVSYPSNRFVLAATPGVGIVAGLATLIAGDGWGAAVANGFSAGGITFLAWTVARELHPDRAWLATVAALVGPFVLLLGEPDLLAAAVVMLTARIVAATTGRPLYWVDVAVVAAVAVPVAVRATGPGVLSVSAVALFAIVPLQDRRRLELVAAAVLLAGLAAYSWTRVDFGFDPAPWAFVAAGLGAIGLLGPTRVEVGCDREGGVIVPRRVRAARAVALASLVLTATMAPPEALAPAWAGVAVLALRPT